MKGLLIAGEMQEGHGFMVPSKYTYFDFVSFKMQLYEAASAVLPTSSTYQVTGLKSPLIYLQVASYLSPSDSRCLTI